MFNAVSQVRHGAYQFGVLGTWIFAALAAIMSLPDMQAWGDIPVAPGIWSLDGRGGWYITDSARTDRGKGFGIVHILSDGSREKVWASTSNDTVSALAVAPDGKTVYVAFWFANQPGGYIAALDVATRTATNWNPGADEGGIRALAVSGDGTTVYAGGGFIKIGGQPRKYIAALDVVRGIVTAWDPGADGEVYALSVSRSTVYAAGHFKSIAGQNRDSIAAIDAATGVATPWNPGAVDGGVEALAMSGVTVYVGGWFTSIAAQSRTGIAAIDTATGTVNPWNPGTNGAIHDLAVSGDGSIVYAGGSFSRIGGQRRNWVADGTPYCIVALNPTTGAVMGWNPDARNDLWLLILLLALPLLLLWIYPAICFSRIASKVDTPGRWMAWVPILNLVLVCRVGGQSGWWVLLCLIPYLGAIIALLLMLQLPKALGVSSPARFLIVIPLLNFVYLGYLAFRKELPKVTA